MAVFPRESRGEPGQLTAYIFQTGAVSGVPLFYEANDLAGVCTSTTKHWLMKEKGSAVFSNRHQSKGLGLRCLLSI